MQNKTKDDFPGRLPLNLAIVGGGKTCKSFLSLLKDEPFPYLNIKLVGVCDIEPKAQGLKMAEALGIYTTNDFRDIFKIKDLDVVIELTHSREVLLEIMRHKPKGVGVVEYGILRLFESLFTIDQKLKSAEQQVVLEKMASKFLIEQVNERVVVLYPDFSIVEANESYLEAVAKSKDEVIGGHCYEVTHGLTAPCSISHPELGCPLMETLKTGESAHVLHEHPSPGEHSTYCDMVTYPLKDQNGEIVRVIEVWRDITDELSLRWERRINAFKDDLKKLVQKDRMISLGKLVASSVHEINNPIQGLLTFSHLMQDMMEEGRPSPEDLEKFKEFLRLMSNELERCGSIISGLLSFSRQSVMEYSNVDLNEILESVIELTRHKMALQNIQLSTNLSPSPPLVKGDVNQLQQCFLNLIFNAIEAMPQGGRLNVTTEIDRVKKNARVKIQDTGQGIPEEILDHIFDPFFTTKEEGEGTGLGLSIVHGIVKAHDGDIKVNSQIAKGCSFTLIFPA